MSAISKGTKTRHACAQRLRIDSYDRFQQTYKVKNILTNLRFDEQKYRDYSPIYLSTTFALNYGLSFAAIAATVVHVGLWHGKEIVERTKGAVNEPKDIHQKLYEKYPQVPLWWCAAMFFAFVGVGTFPKSRVWTALTNGRPCDRPRIPA
jgi:hypothetical protein